MKKISAVWNLTMSPPKKKSSGNEGRKMRSVNAGTKTDISSQAFPPKAIPV